MIYADNAATTRLDPEALEAMKPFLMEEYGNPSQPYSFSRSAKKAVREARRTIARCIGADPEEIYFTSGGTESDNWAIKSGITGSGGAVLSVIEHHAVLRAGQFLERNGHDVKYLPVSAMGVVNPSNLIHLLERNTQLVSVMYVNNEIGSIQPICELADVAHQNHTLFHTDAVQAVGHVPIDVRELGVDLLSASAHKFNGPKGIGFLYIKKGTRLDPFMNGGGQEHGMRAGTENVASIVGMATALEQNVEQMPGTAKRLRECEQTLTDELSAADIDYIRNGCSDGVPGNVSLSFAGFEGEMLLHRMDLMGICVSTGSACDSKRTEISHVIQAIGCPENYALGTIRISFGRYNTQDEAAQIANALIRIIKGH